MKKRGTIVRWDAARGFGFIRSAEVAGEVFFHVKAFQSNGPPREGMVVNFEDIHVGGKGPRATFVQVLGSASERPTREAARASRRQHANPTAPAQAPSSLLLLVMLAWAALVLWGWWAARLPWHVLVALPVLNLLTFYLYWSDKYAAQRGHWRTSESTLHVASLLGGWPGAWFAQRALRHKSRKQAFRATYWGTVLLHMAVLVGWLFWLFARVDFSQIGR